MQPIIIKKHSIKPLNPKGANQRKIVQISNQIAGVLAKVGVHEDDVEVQKERVAIKRCPAEVFFWVDGQHCHYSYHQCTTFIENLWVVYKFLEAEVAQVLAKDITLDEFAYSFSEKSDVTDLRKEAREIIGVAEDCFDMDEVQQKYKKLAKKYHPDMPNGDHEEFQKINKAHKVLKKELE
jgi:hypothetical protein